MKSNFFTSNKSRVGYFITTNQYTKWRIVIFLDDLKVQTIKTSLNQQLAGYSIDISAITPTQLTITKPVKIQAEIPENDEVDEENTQEELAEESEDESEKSN